MLEGESMWHVDRHAGFLQVEEVYSKGQKLKQTLSVFISRGFSPLLAPHHPSISSSTTNSAILSPISLAGGTPLVCSSQRRHWCLDSSVRTA
jgi:hypothetical protein